MKMERALMVMKMMSNPIRLKILKVLADNKGGICVGGIEDILNIPQPSISQHLAHLRNSGMLRHDKKGKTVCYEIVEPCIKKLLENLEIDDLNTFVISE